MNQFFYLINEKTGSPELVTCPLDQGTILPGVTRDSILQLTREWAELSETDQNCKC